MLSLKDIIQLKELLSKQGYTLHSHDTCGGQSFEIECEGEVKDDVYSKIEEFFNSRRMRVEFYGRDKKGFTAR